MAGATGLEPAASAVTGQRKTCWHRFEIIENPFIYRANRGIFHPTHYWSNWLKFSCSAYPVLTRSLFEMAKISKTTIDKIEPDPDRDVLTNCAALACA
jgi:hypothetical protein